VNFYRTLAPKVGIRIPANYIADYDQESGFSMILVEDLGDLRFVRQFASENLSLADTTSVVETLASLHARWWNDESLGSYEWIANSSSDSQIAMSAAQYKESVEPFLNTFREFLADGFDSFAHSFARNAVDVISRFGSGSQTLTHRDFRLDNMAFDDSAAEGTGRVVLFDWGTVGLSIPGSDLGRFISGGLSTENRRDNEKALVSAYYERLQEGGISDYSRTELDLGLQLGALQGVMTSTIGTAKLDLGKLLESAEGRQAVEEGASRFQTLIDWNVDELVSR